MRQFNLVIFFILVYTTCNSQNIVISNTKTATELVNYLVGPGITISNVTTNNSGSNQKGSFTGGGGTSTTFPIGNGIVLTSGSTADIKGYNTSNGTSVNANGGGDTDFNKLIPIQGSETDDCSIIEFDFIATSDTFSFEYVFGSEEYPDFVCSQFFDMFGFLLSGPNPKGGTYSNLNLATCPNSNIPVNINTINGGNVGKEGTESICSNINPNWKNYSNYYISNPKNANTYNVKMNGFTKILTAGAKLVCGQKYHIKFGVCDAGYQGDTELDSYVFIKEGSFKSPGITSTSEVNTNGTVTNNKVITEGCSKGELTMNFSPVPTSNFNQTYTLGGTATNGTDYTNLSGTASILANQGSTIIIIDPINDGIGESTPETVTISTSSCTSSSATEFIIVDPIAINCTNTANSITFNWNNNGATQYNYSYKINGGAAVTGNTATGITTFTINSLSSGNSVAFTITPNFGTNGNGCPVTETCTIANCTQPTITGANSVCIGNTISLTGSGTPATTGAWTSSDDTKATISNTGVVTGVSSGTVNITYKDNAGCSKTHSVVVNPLPTVTGNTNVCVGSTISLTGSGTPATTGAWTSSDITKAIIDNSGIVTGVSNGTVSITYKNSDGCLKTYSVTVNPLPSITGNTSVCMGSSITLTGSGTAATSGAWTSSDIPKATIDNSGIVAGVASGTVTITYKNSDGCKNTQVISINNCTCTQPTVTGPTEVCSGNTISLIGSGTPATTGAWTSLDITKATISNSGVVTAVSSGTVGITYKDITGCTKVYDITVKPLPNISANPSNPSTCSGDGSIALTLTNVPNGTYSINYTGGSFTGVVINNNTANISSVPVGSYNNLQITSNGCTSPLGVNATITAPTKPVLTINTPAAVCSPATLDLTSNAIISGSTGVLVGGITYWTDALANTPVTNPTAVNTTGTFYIKAVNGICSDIKPVTLTINSCSCPVALNITNPSAVCSPFGVDLTSSSITAGSTGVGSFTYWEDATASTSPLTNFNNVTVGKTYYIKMSGGACTDIKPVVVTINQSPILKITDPTAVCSPNTVNITSSSITAGSTGGGTLSYWKDQLATNNLSNPSLINISDIYYIKSTTTAGCSDIKPVNVTIGTKPTLIITNPTSVCSPNTIDLTLTSVTTGSTNVNSLTYWQDPVASLVLTNVGNINSSNTIYIKAENGNCYDIKPVIVTIKPSPNLKITNPSEICEPNTVNLLDPSITNGSSNIGSLSYFSDQNLTTPINNPSNYNQIGTNTLYISTTNSNGCSDSKPVKVIINPLDIINITSPTSLCSNAPLEKIVATPTNGTWIGKGIKSDGSLQASLATIGLNDYTYTSSGKCPTNKTIQITIKEKPDLKISSKDTVCEKEDVLFQDVSINTNLVKCEWRFGDNTNSTILKETKHAYLNAGDYDVTLIGTDAQGCSDTIIENKFVHVLIRPKTKFSFEPLKPTIFNNSIQTTNLTTDATNYLWDFGDDTKTTLVNPSHKYGNTPNIYIITLNAYNKITSCNHDTTIEVEIFDEIYCYVPNSFTPNGDELNNEFKPILSGSVAEENYSLYIFNRWGQLLFESHNKNVGWNGAFGNKISAPGTYIWKIEFTDTINKVKHMKTGHINLVN